LGVHLFMSNDALAQESPHGKPAFACEECRTSGTFGVLPTQCYHCHRTPTNYTTTCCTNSGCHNSCQGAN